VSSFDILFFPVWNLKGFSKASEIISIRFWVFGERIEEKFISLGSYFISKNYLYNQNQKLEGEVVFDDARMANYDSIVADDAI